MGAALHETRKEQSEWQDRAETAEQRERNAVEVVEGIRRALGSPDFILPAIERLRARAETAERQIVTLEEENRTQRLSASKVIEAVLQWGGHQESCVFDTEGCSCGWHAVCEALDHHKDQINGK
jgi:hypothetical protein